MPRRGTGTGHLTTPAPRDTRHGHLDPTGPQRRQTRGTQGHLVDPEAQGHARKPGRGGDALAGQPCHPGRGRPVAGPQHGGLVKEKTSGQDDRGRRAAAARPGSPSPATRATQRPVRAPQSRTREEPQTTGIPGGREGGREGGTAPHTTVPLTGPSRPPERDPGKLGRKGKAEGQGHARDGGRSPESLLSRPPVPSPFGPRGPGRVAKAAAACWSTRPGSPGSRPAGRPSPKARRQPPATTDLQAQALARRCHGRRPATNQMAPRRLLASRSSASFTSGTVPCFACRTGASGDKRLGEKRPPGGARPQPAPAIKRLLQNTGRPSGAHHFRGHGVPRGHQTQSRYSPRRPSRNEVSFYGHATLNAPDLV